MRTIAVMGGHLILKGSLAVGNRVRRSGRRDLDAHVRHSLGGPQSKRFGRVARDLAHRHGSASPMWAALQSPRHIREPDRRRGPSTTVNRRSASQRWVRRVLTCVRLKPGTTTHRGPEQWRTGP